MALAEILAYLERKDLTQRQRVQGLRDQWQKQMRALQLEERQQVMAQLRRTIDSKKVQPEVTALLHDLSWQG